MTGLHSRLTYAGTALLVALGLTGCSPPAAPLEIVVVAGASDPSDQNTLPEILGIVADPGPNVPPGAIVDLTCVASDADQDTLVYSWSKEAGSIVNVGANVLWVSPGAPGIYKVTCTVQDPSGEPVSSTAELFSSETAVTIHGPLPPEATTVRLTVSGDDIEADLTATFGRDAFVGDQLVYRLFVPPGDERTFGAVAFNAQGEAVAVGTVLARVLAGQLTAVSLTLEPTNGA